MCFTPIEQIFRDFPMGPAKIFRPVVTAASCCRYLCRDPCADSVLRRLTAGRSRRFVLPPTPVVVEGHDSCTFLWDGEQETPVGLDCRRLFLVCLQDSQLRATRPTFDTLRLAVSRNHRNGQSTFLLTWGLWGPVDLSGSRLQKPASFTLAPVGGLFVDPCTGVEVSIDRSLYRPPDCELVSRHIITAVDTVLPEGSC